MKKIIFVLNAAELMTQLFNGRKVQGVLYLDEDSNRLTFKPNKRSDSTTKRDSLIKKLAWGWVKESTERTKVFGSFPKEFSTGEVLRLLDRHTDEAKGALVDREIDLLEFC